MDQLLRDHFEHLKSSLLSLPATGEKGFEGLVAEALYEISGVPFRLAGSGSQFGVDGKPAYEGDTIYFECKRYKGKVPRNEVLAKIAELSINNSETGIWVLGATSRIRSQLADDARALGNTNGIFVLILDWSETVLPPLAVALAMGRTRVQQFLKSNISDATEFQKIVSALEAVGNHQDFPSHSNSIRALCNEPTVGWTLARRANTNWLTDTFSSRKRAKIEFGQPLSPCDLDTKNVLMRKDLIDKLRPYLTATPDEAVVFILGGEGHGKSWIIAQSWLNLKHKPLMILLSPDDFAETSGQNDVIDILINKLIRQTGDQVTANTQERWRRKLGQWRSNSTIDGPRVIAVIDGINQRPKYDWARIIEKVGDDLKKLGGCLIVTTRTPYFQDRVKSRLSAMITEIPVPEWTESERDEVLARHAINASTLHPKVATSLRNPRLLGIALELLDKAEITNFEELSVSRLLFEHIRTSERDAPIPQPAQEFAHQLQIHAQEIISRTKSKQQDDLNIFEQDIGAVADGRFYKAIDGDPTRYSLKDDGLTLALGFSVIDRLLTAHRNNRNLDAELDAILEPIAALDDTADVILASLTVVVTDEQFEQVILTSLVRGFSGLQNPDETKFPAFSGLAKSRPQGFMDAACALSLDGEYQPNFDWIQGALIEASKIAQAWKRMSETVRFWLSLYSLSPDLACFKHLGSDPEEEVQKEREKNCKKIEERLQALTKNEQTILENLHEQDGDLSRLSRLALLLLAGKSLVPFTKSFLDWNFSQALNSDHYVPYKEFWHLLRLNQADWSDARTTLLEASSILQESNISSTGKWALVNILRATGDSDDSNAAKTLVDELTKDRPHFEGWRLIEKYCTTDPCDPASKKPKNITQTTKQYSAIDVRSLRQYMGHSTEDLFFEMARTGMARFKPDIAIAKHREFVTDVINRSGVPLRQGLFELRNHNSLITHKHVRELLSKFKDIKNSSATTELSEHDLWFASQSLLLIAFPHLNAEKQYEILLSVNTDENLLLDLLYLVKPLRKNKFTSLLGKACNENNERKQYLLLTLATYSDVKLSKDSNSHIEKLFHSKSERVRRQALTIIALSNDKALLDMVAKSNWKASEIKTENSFEIWYGSVALLEAAKKGLIAINKILDRISEKLYGRAATILGTDDTHEIALCIDASIKRTINLEENLVAPDIELQILPSDSDEPSRFSIREQSSEDMDTQEAMKRMSESNEEFAQRQERIHKNFLQFRDNLTDKKADIILNHISLKEFEVIVTTAGEYADRWYQLFMGLPDSKLSIIHNFIALLAHVLSSIAPEKAKNLFARIKNIEPTISFTYTRARNQLGAMAVWSCERNPILDDIRFTRLDMTNTDYALSQEVLAAHLNDQQELLTRYIEPKLCSKEPAEISRGIMVAGFSEQSKFNDEVLKKYEKSHGLIGSAFKAAKYAYERNIWARHWFKEMCQTNKNTEFWCYSVLFLKIVDGRFEAWGSGYTQKSNPILLFGPAVDSRLKNRYDRWKNLRNKKLFGADAPEPIFLEGKRIND